MNNLPEFIKKYKQLDLSRSIFTRDEKKYDSIAVVPAIDEYDNLIVLLNSLAELEKKYLDDTLFLFVINNSDKAGEGVKENNRRSLEMINNLICNKITDTRLNPGIIESGLNLGTVDASTPGNELPDKHAGVGYARKTGMDLALTKFDYSNDKKKIIICLDADCTVDNNYLTEIVESFNKRNLNAAYVDYEHTLPSDEIEKSAAITYEIFLRYYTLMLKYTNSPYAYQTIGSTMVCTAEFYCKAGGMNKKKAGEDFYFLEKLRKQTDIKLISGAKVRPAGRISWRVPFGTGRSINEFCNSVKEKGNAESELSVYNPSIFLLLKKWHAVYYRHDYYENGREILNSAVSVHEGIEKFLVEQGFPIAWERINENAASPDQIMKQKFLWFDAFRTMKLIHYLRDNYFPNVNLFDAVDRMFELYDIKPGIARKGNIPGIEEQMKYLDYIRKLYVKIMES
ncbi:hypothetical protein MROS_0737 [Melioribacter roseus P3M-2]|uniref:Glycosyltransferase 2-like domain-containing protein n=1 Tax=Melioribacter roseus (strain DSM 23840 / JCM 17771 / VKM B-2668 / P3M-2) TaxID=1191523 RepID=I6ZPM5_MELRP|nr:glycosyltransferase [Melioribacter roseus]AFN73979.1 hypothetical protein MROS_0737 [Melioribacter roseus P3M-2]